MPTYLRNPSYYYYYDFFFFFFFYYFKLLLRDDDHDNDHEANATHSQLLRIPCCYMLPLLLVPSRSLQYYSQYRVCCYYSTIVFNVCVCVCVFFSTPAFVDVATVHATVHIWLILLFLVLNFDFLGFLCL